jgi:MFS family permease
VRLSCAPVSESAHSSSGFDAYVRLFRNNRDFRLLYIATLISLAGDWFHTVALLDLVLELTSSATLASLVIVLQSLPVFIATPFAGALIDRVDRRKLMIATDLVRCAAALLPLLTHNVETLIFSYIGVSIISAGVAYFDPAAQAALPNMVSKEELGPANVLIGSTWGTMLAVGAGLGGLVTMYFGRNVAFVVDALTFLVSAWLVWRIRVNFSEASTIERVHPPLIESMRETFRYARAHPRVLALLGSKGGFGIGGGVSALLGVFGREIFRAGASGIGILYAARGVGALAGPFLVRWMSRSDDEQYRKIALCGAIFGTGYIGLAWSPTLAIGALCVCLAHIGGGAQWLTSTYGLQREVPDYIRGRVFSVDYAFVTLTMGISGLVAGVAADRFGVVAATVGVASLSIVWSVVWGVGTWRLWRGE